MPAKNKNTFNEDSRAEKMSAIMCTLTQKGRLAKGLTQRDLAVKINEKQHIVKDYEAGRGVINNTILAKIERVIGLKLRGKDIGKPLDIKLLKESK